MAYCLFKDNTSLVYLFFVNDTVLSAPTSRLSSGAEHLSRKQGVVSSILTGGSRRGLDRHHFFPTCLPFPPEQEQPLCPIHRPCRGCHNSLTTPVSHTCRLPVPYRGRRADSGASCRRQLLQLQTLVLQQQLEPTVQLRRRARLQLQTLQPLHQTGHLPVSPAPQDRSAHGQGRSRRQTNWQCYAHRT